MKKSILIVLFFFFVYSSYCQAPNGISYQSAIRNNNGTLVSNQPIQLRFSIRDSSMNGTIVYQETHSTTTSSLGMVTLMIGQGLPNIGSFSLIYWQQHSKFLQTDMMMNGASSFVDIGTHQMMSVPYALYAENGLQEPLLPNVLTTAINYSSLQNFSSNFNCGGCVLNSGGSAILARGICWGFQPDPTITDNHTNDGTSLGTFTSTLTDLLENTTYYIRAYTTNHVGTSYGNLISFKTSLTIGSNYQGGIIGYILKPGDNGYIVGEVHGLIVSSNNQGISSFPNLSNAIVSCSNLLGTGQINTQALVIVTQSISPSNPAIICDNLILNGFNDWYLPSREELMKLYLNRNAIGGFNSIYLYNHYWSSSELSGGTSYPTYTSASFWGLNFSTGEWDGLGNSSSLSSGIVRAVRSF